MKKPAFAVSMIITFFFALFFTVWLILFRADYYIFTESRINEMENKFSMDLSMLKLERYTVGEYRASLEFYGIEDYSDFIENKVNGEIAGMAKDGVFYDYRENTHEKYDSVTEELMKKYDVMYYITGSNGFDYRIRFYEESNGKYSAEASYSTWEVCF